jgi:Mg2+-importing ATPase
MATLRAMDPARGTAGGGSDEHEDPSGAAAGPFWARSADHALAQLGSSMTGLAGEEAAARLAGGRAALVPRRKIWRDLLLLLGQFSSPLGLLLLGAAGLSAILHDPTDALIIFAIVVASGLAGFWQERGAADAVAGLLSRVRVHARVLRDGRPQECPLEEVVPGDVVDLAAGSAVPGDCLLLSAKELHANEAALTGETFPVEKVPGVLPADAPLAGRTNSLFQGTFIVSGEARALVARVGRDTEFGRIAVRLGRRKVETDFERGVRRFGFFLLEVTLVLVLAIFAVNVWFHRPVLEALLFSLALAVGLTPQLLPAIISVNLAAGARRMAKRNVIVKRLASIENFGSMDVLCSDKTGTVTEGIVRLQGSEDVRGRESDRVLLHAWLNAAFQRGFANPIDDAIRARRPGAPPGYAPLDVVPYDFARKRLSVLAATPDGPLLVTKGALARVLDVCTLAEDGEGATVPLDEVRASVEARAEALGRDGFRTLGVACRRTGAGPITREDETGMTFLGLLVLHDPPRAGVAEAVAELAGLGVAFKMISGDTAPVARHVAQQLGLPDPRVLTGAALHETSDEALGALAPQIDVFAEIEPNQKERIISALRHAGHTVGYMGDGINDAPAIRAADVGISVDGAVDVAKDAADIVLLEKDLHVLLDGLREGRSTFANTMKYVLMATAANFGNMFSMAGASLFLPFLPLLPKQILVTNALTDMPETQIAADRVDPEMIARPRRWDLAFIRRFMLVFGVVSSVFDFLTFGVLLLLLHATPEQFRTGWFVESVVSAALVVLVVRTRHPLLRSRPGRGLLLATLGVVALALALPWTPLAAPLGFVPIPLWFLAVLLGIVAAYGVCAELAKRIFYRVYGERPNA